MFKFRLLIVFLLFVVSSSISFASLQPGEIAFRGKLINDRSGKITFYINDKDKEYTFKKSRKPKFKVILDTINAKNTKGIDALQEAGEAYWVIAIIYYDPQKFDKVKNADYQGYEIRRLLANSKKFQKEAEERQKASNPHL